MITWDTPLDLSFPLYLTLSSKRESLRMSEGKYSAFFFEETCSTGKSFDTKRCNDNRQIDRQL